METKNTLQALIELHTGSKNQNEAQKMYLRYARGLLRSTLYSDREALSFIEHITRVFTKD